MQTPQRVIKSTFQRLSQLTPTARLLIGSLMVCLVLALFLVAVFAGRASMVPLGLSSTLPAEARARAISFIEQRGIAYEDLGGDVAVPVDQKYTILSQLTQEQVIAGDQINFETLVKEVSPFLSREQNRTRFLIAKMNVLARVISEIEGVERATVVIDQATGSGAIGRAHVPPSASVTVTPGLGRLPQTKVDAIARLVAGAQAGLAIENVQVIDARTGQARRAHSEGEYGAYRHLELQQNTEKIVRQRIADALAYIPGVKVTVNVMVNSLDKTTTTHSYEDPKVGPVSETTSLRSSTRGEPSAEPGVQPNVGATLASAVTGQSSLSDERNEASMIPAFGEKDSRVRDPGGYARKINATIGVPRSYFLMVFRQQQGDPEAEPDDATLKSMVAAEEAKIQKQVVPLIDTEANDGATAGTVVVSMIPDFAIAGMGTVTPGGAGGSESGGLSGIAGDGLVKYISLGGLALLSVAMMLMMVRRATVREELPTVQELVGLPPALQGADAELIGEASEAEPALEGREVDEETIRRQQMLEQIHDMVNSAPDEAASLLRRWIRSEE